MAGSADGLYREMRAKERKREGAVEDSDTPVDG